MRGRFDAWSNRDIRDIVAAYPMASIIPDGEPFSAIEMPVLLDCDEEGRPASLLGHLPRRAPVTALLAGSPRCTFLFRGPGGYISPAAARKSDWAPTWNFVVVRMAADVVLDEALTDTALDRIVAHMERDNPEPWNRTSLGRRYDTLRSAVIGFRAPVRAIAARFKLGQDEQRETFDHIVASLGDTALSRWMKRMNAKEEAERD